MVEIRESSHDPDAWGKRQFVKGRDFHQCLRRKQRGGIMIWTVIIIIIVVPKKVPDRIKIIADAYIISMIEHFELFLKRKGSLSKEPSYLCKIMFPHMQCIKIRSICCN